MGTNYYLHTKPDCKCCGRPFEALHIGKSSAGWCFALHVFPEEGINTLQEWRELWSKSGSFIRDEYGQDISVSEIERLITERRWKGKFPKRHELDGRHCIKHGHGTYDYIIGEFL